MISSWLLVESLSLLNADVGKGGDDGNIKIGSYELCFLIVALVLVVAGLLLFVLCISLVNVLGGENDVERGEADGVEFVELLLRDGFGKQNKTATPILYFG